MTIPLTLDDLQAGWKKVAANKGAPGVDGVSIQTYQQGVDSRLKSLLTQWNSGDFVPHPYKVVTIPKSDNRTRKLAIPTVRDRIIHTAIATQLVQYFEPEFESISYGYRPNRSYTHAIRHIEQLRNQGYYFVLDADIEGYFDNICHDILKLILNKYLSNTWTDSLLNLLLTQQEAQSQLAFGRENGIGIPQGSPISPLLANLYLDGFDEALIDRGEQIIRYADDFVVLVADEQKAQRCLNFVTQYLAKLKLNLNAEKTRVVSFEQGFTFLGVTFLDNMVLPLKAHTEKSLVSLGKYEFELSEDEAELIRSDEDQSLNATLWHASLPPALRSLQAAIYDDDSFVATEPDIERMKRLAVNHIARLKLVYLHKQGAAVHKSGNRLNIFFNGKPLSSIPANTIDMILCFGSIHLTHAVQRFCLTNEITVIWLTQSGQYLGCLAAPYQGDPKLTQAQIYSQANSEVRIQLSKFFVRSKINNSLGVMRRFGRKQQRDKSSEKQIVAIRDSLDKKGTLPSIRGTEGAAARAYFSWYKQQFDAEWNFTTRNRQPPKDPINAMLSYGYTLLFHNLRALLEARGLLPHIGYLHGDQPNQPSLVLDLMEGYRPWLVDELILQLASKKLITPEQFAYNSSGCWLNRDGRRVLIQSFEQKMLSEHQHPTLKIKADVRRLMDIQILEFRHQLLTGQWSLTQQRIR
ncbi:CRISPR-associated endonuclease Cas1 [Vibrio sp. DNB22_12_1]